MLERGDTPEVAIDAVEIPEHEMSASQGELASSPSGPGAVAAGEEVEP